MSPDRERLALDMRVTARHLFEYALAEASIDRAFQRHVDCERGVLRIFEDLFYLESYRRIVEINAIRKHLSAVKGGRLAQAAAPAQQVSLLVSDVPDNTPDALASGPTMPDSTTVSDCHAIAQKYGMLEQFPASVRELFDRGALEETPKSDDPAFHRSRWWTLLSNASLLQAAKVEAERHGFAVEIDDSCDDWDYVRAADYLLARLGR